MDAETTIRRKLLVLREPSKCYDKRAVAVDKVGVIERCACFRVLNQEDGMRLIAKKV